MKFFLAAAVIVGLSAPVQAAGVFDVFLGFGTPKPGLLCNDLKANDMRAAVSACINLKPELFLTRSYVWQISKNFGVRRTFTNLYVENQHVRQSGWFCRLNRTTCKN